MAHVDLSLRRNRTRSLQWITKTDPDVTTDDLDLVAELLETALTRE